MTGTLSRNSLRESPRGATPIAMPRMARVVAVAVGHHITRRGNYRQTVFFEDSDRQLYLTYCRKTPRATPPPAWVLLECPIDL
jgi:hypothetical protein